MVKRNITSKMKKFSDFTHKRTTAIAAIKKGGGSAFTHSKNSANPYRPDPTGGKKGSQFRTRATIKRINMYNDKPNESERHKTPTDPHVGRIQPDRKWFGNVRTADQKELDKYRKALLDTTEKKSSGFTVHLKSKKLPLSLVKDSMTKSLSEGERLLQVQTFEKTFGKGSQRKRPTIGNMDNLADLFKNANDRFDGYDEKKDNDIHKHDFIEFNDAVRHSIFDKGLSRRIWDELYKVIDSSDVVIYVLDGRNPLGMRNERMENHLKKNCPNKHLIFVLNKCDLVPTSVTQKWIKHLN